MNDPITITIPGNPYPMTKPKSRIVVPEDEDKRAFATWDWPAPYLEWKQAAQSAAKTAMRHRMELFEGFIAIEAVFSWTRPQGHYNSAGAIKEHFLHTSPVQWPLLHELLRGAVDSMHGVAIRNLTDIVHFQVSKVWAAVGSAEITIRQINPKEIDPQLADVPQQGELGL